MARTEATFTDPHERGWDSPLFEISKYETAEKLLKACCTVLMEEKVRGKPWDKDPQKTARKGRTKT